MSLMSAGGCACGGYGGGGGGAVDASFVIHVHCPLNNITLFPASVSFFLCDSLCPSYCLSFNCSLSQSLYLFLLFFVLVDT